MNLWDRLRRRKIFNDGEPLALQDSSEGESVEGERGASAVQRPPSLQSRLSNVLALALMGTLGIGLLSWYSLHVAQNRAATRSAAQSSAQERAKGEVNLRPLGRVDPPVLAAPVEHGSMMEDVLGSAPEEPPADIPPAWLQPAGEPQPSSHATSAYPVKSPRDLQLERQLSGRAFAGNTAPLTSTSSSGSLEDVGDAASGGSTGGDLDGLLRPAVTTAVNAKVLPTRRLLLPKGAFIDCTLETALDSTLPGMTTCVMATDTFSADGSVVLLERGTKLVGETRGQVRQGSARVFVLWTEARTPTGVVVPLASAGTDELGRSGLPGKVNRHFFERFGAAILISVIDGAIQAKVQSEGSGTVIFNPSTSQDIMTEVLKSTVNIPPTVVKPQGDRIQVLVARDLDFRSVYELRPTASGR